MPGKTDIIFVTVKEAADLECCTTSNITKNCRANKFNGQSGGEGKPWRIPITSLSETAQKKWNEKNLYKEKPNQSDKLFYQIKSLIEFDESGQNETNEIRELNSKQELQAKARGEILREYNDFMKNCSHGEKADKRKQFISVIIPIKFMHLSSIIKLPTNYKIIQRWEKEFSASENDYRSLANKRKNRVRFNFPIEIKGLVIIQYLHPHKFQKEACIDYAINEAIRKQISPIPSKPTVRRWLDNFIASHYDIKVFLRDGQREFETKVLPDITRDNDSISVGVLISVDGKKLDVFVRDPLSGLDKRYTILLAVDVYSGVICSYVLCETENSAAIKSLIYRCIIFLGKIPKCINQDNGRAFNASLFTDEEEGILNRLLIQKIVSWPYHGQSKIVEGINKIFGEFEKSIPYYWGNNNQRPAHWNRGNFANREQYKKIYGENELTKDRLESILVQFIDRINDRIIKTGNNKGRKRIDIFNEGKGPGVDKNKLWELMLKREHRKLTKNGIRTNGNDYWHPSLYGRSGFVDVRYDAYGSDSVLIYDEETGKFICEAFKKDSVHPAARLSSPEDQEKLKKAIQHKKYLEKITVSTARELYEKVLLPEYQAQNQKQYQEANILSIPANEPKQLTEAKKVEEILEFGEKRLLKTGTDDKTIELETEKRNTKSKPKYHLFNVEDK